MAAAREIHTAACLIIGDEVLNGKTVDTNSSFMAKWCFSNGIALKRIETIEDDETEIVEAVRRMSARYDFVVTSGGIGPTHDDITYPSIAKAFGLPLTLHGPTAKRMRRLSKTEADFDWDADTPQREAKWRMARLPLVAADSKNEGQGEEAAAVDDGEDDDDARVIFPYEDLWVPVVVVNENVHILPGVPQLFEKLLNGILPTLLPRIAHRDAHQHRVLVTTPRSESRIAAYLAQLAARVAALGVKVGSYPVWIDAFQAEHNTVSLVGRDRAVLDGLAKEVVREVDGVLVEEAGDKGAAGGGEEAAK